MTERCRNHVIQAVDGVKGKAAVRPLGSYSSCGKPCVARKRKATLAMFPQTLAYTQIQKGKRIVPCVESKK